MGAHDSSQAALRSIPSTVVVEVAGLQWWASQKSTIEAVLGRQPGVMGVDANPVSQTATVTFDPESTSVAELRTWIQECGYHCAGQSVPSHVCDPMSEPVAATPQVMARLPHEVMGHGGHESMSMARWSADMRDRFLVAAVFSIPILLWSPIGRDVLNFYAAGPFGLRDDVWSLLLSLPVIFYSCSIFFVGAYRCAAGPDPGHDGPRRGRHRRRLALFGVITLTGGGEVFYEAASVLAAFVLLGHWFEMRARGARTTPSARCSTSPPPMALVLRDGEPVEVPTAEVVVGDLLLVRPGPGAIDGVGRGRRQRRRRVDGHGREPARPKGTGATVIGATINTTAPCESGRRGSAPTPRWPRSSARPRGAELQSAGPKLADRAAFWLVLVALIGGALTFLAWSCQRRPTKDRSCSRSRSWSSRARTRSGSRPRPRSWSAPGWAPIAACCSRTPSRSRLGPHRGRRHGQDRHAHVGRARGDRRRRRRIFGQERSSPSSPRSSASPSTRSPTPSSAGGSGGFETERR